MKAWRLATLRALVAVLVLAGAGMGSDAAQIADALPEAESLTGQLLVASPETRDLRFTQTVIYVVQHGANGAMGLVLNRPMGEIPLARVLEQLRIEHEGINGKIRVHYGGPVEMASGFVLHTPDYVGTGTVIINDTMALTRTSQILRDIANGTGPRQRLFALGYAGWGPGQLEAEIEAGHWATLPADEALVFDDDYDGKWQRAMDRRAIRL